MPKKLAVDLITAESSISKRIEKGKELLLLQIQSEEDYNNVNDQFSKWTSYNKDLLLKLFTNNEVLKEYNPGYGLIALGATSLHQDIEDLKQKIKRSVLSLETIFEKLELYL